ncbi:MAG: GEVED domain-containing protein [Chitinophagales bacterium]
MLLTLASGESRAQCSGCTTTINSNTGFSVNSGQVVCYTFTGSFNKTITLNGGTLCVAPGANITGGTINTNSASTINNYGNISVTLNNWNSGCILNNYGSFTGGISMGSGSQVNNFSGGTLSPSSFTPNGGTMTNAAGGTMTLPGGLNFPSGFILTSNGTANLGSFTLNSGSTVSLNGTTTISGNVQNNASFTLAGPATISGTFRNNNTGTTNFSGGITITGNTNNDGTINLAGNLSIGGTYADNSGATIKQTQSGCSTVTISGGNSGGNGTFNGNGNGMIINSAPGNPASMINGASATITAPTQQPTGLSLSVTNLLVNGSFTAPSASISGYIVLRKIGAPVPTDNPTAYGNYSVGSTIGACTVVALVTGGSTGTKTFSDLIPISGCGQNVYYRIFSYNGGGACKNFYLSSPLTGNTTFTNPTATITSSGVTTFCVGGSVTLTASGGSTYSWSTGAASASIVATTTNTYTVTVTNTTGCTASANRAVTVNGPTPSVNNGISCNGSTVTLTATGGTTYVWSTGATSSSISTAVAGTYTVTATTSGCTATASGVVTSGTAPIVSAASNSPVNVGSTINLTSSVSGGTSPYTYSWSGPASFTSSAASPSITGATAAMAGTYTITVTGNNTCSASASTAVVIVSPGGTASNLKLWLKANTGVTSVATLVTAWNDQSGSGNNATTVNGVSPVFTSNQINAYPTVNFSSTGGLQGTFTTAITSNNITAFAVAQPQTGGTNPSIFSIAPSGTADNTSALSSALFYNNGTNLLTYRNSSSLGNSPGAINGLPSAFTTSFSASYDSFFTNGRYNNRSAYTAAAFNGQVYTIGSRYPAALANYLTGKVAEVVFYDRQLTPAERNRVESYLAIKYGLSLSQTVATNYNSSSGITYWSASANGIYNNNIFGVGIDNGSALNQTGSVSINTSKLSIANASSLTDNSFLMVSDNGGADVVTAVSGLPDTIDGKISLQWRVSQTGTRTAADFTYDRTSTGFGVFASIASAMTPCLLVDSNADGVYERSVRASSIVGNLSTFNANLPNGALFTIGFDARLDYGDAMGAATPLASGGAAHVIVPGVKLGTKEDTEADGIPSPNSLSDDTTGVNDDDGVDFNIGVATNGENILQIGMANAIRVTASVAGYLDAWIDYNHNNNFNDPGEQVFINTALAAGLNTISFNISDSVDYGPTAMRFRFALAAGDVTSPSGFATNGEVEDYKVYVTAPLVGPCTNGFQNPGFEMGPIIASNTYLVTDQMNLPYWKTTASDKQVEVWSSPFLGVTAYEGNQFMELNANVPGALYQDIYTQPGVTFIWHFAHHGRDGRDVCNLKIGRPGATVQVALASDSNDKWYVYSGSYTVPANQYITRFEFNAVSTANGSLSIGNLLDDVFVSNSFDYGDAPVSYSTLRAAGGPYHNINTDLRLGANVSCDADGQPSTLANIDTYDDGITFPAVSASATSYTVNVSVYNNTGANATLAGWIDYNKNGVFDAAERVSITVPTSTSQQALTMTFTPPSYSTTAGSIYARFRIASTASEVNLPTGFANSGEVEDYVISCAGLAKPTPINNGPVCARSPLNLTANGTGAAYRWTGPNSYTSSTQNPTISSPAVADSGWYRAYVFFANGCSTDSATRVQINNCTVSINGTFFNDQNGNGVQNVNDTAGNLGQTFYAVLRDTNNVVVASLSVPSNGSFTFTGVPAYTSGLSIAPSTSSVTVGATFSTPSWPANWAGTAGNYGTNNVLATGIYTTGDYVRLITGGSNISGITMGFDRLAVSTGQSYTITHPLHNSQLSLTSASSLGALAATDAEDKSVKTFQITSLASMNSNQLYYDANNDGVLAPGELLSTGAVISNYTPSKLYIKFTGLGSLSAMFDYAAIDSAVKTGASVHYTINWAQALPVKMLYFTAVKEGETGLLKWSTAAEIDNHHFDLERSADASNWEKIAEVEGNGTTSQQHNYSHVDEHPLRGINYYRLIQFDIDGHSETFNIVQLRFDNLTEKVEVQVYPVPASINAELHVVLKNNTAVATIDLIAQNGSVVRHLESADEANSISLEGIAAGSYTVFTTTTSGERFSHHILIQ